MNRSATERFTVEDSAELYGLDGWGNGYFAINDQGHLCVRPRSQGRHAIDLMKALEAAFVDGLRPPVLFRFPQLLRAQLEKLAGAFRRAIDEFEYEGRYFPVFPIKVNQARAVVDNLLASGRKHDLGLEVGSRAELLTALGLPMTPDSLILCNGFKDEEYLRAAMLAARLGRQVVVVIEKPFELESFIDLVKGSGPVPMIGFRIRLQSRGSGLWEKSGGFASKFGLSTLQLLRALDRCRESGLLARVALLHFHIGSQVTEIRKIKNAVLEASRVYAKVCRQAGAIRYVDVGGGLGVDYDGSKTSSDASVNYAIQEYANDVIFGIKEVCDQEGVPTPDVISESGRMLTAYHSMLIIDVRARVAGVEQPPPTIRGDEVDVVLDLAEVERKITVKNYREYYHDAIAYRDQMISQFNLGMLGIEDRAKAEYLFWRIARHAVRHSKTAKFVADEFVDLESKLRDKYICNFSVFQSLPDHWALDQLFPVLPIHRLDEPPDRRATLADITCDSDGEVDRFVDLKDIKDCIDVHSIRAGEPYYLGFALIGAYQDTMGDLHNMLGRVHEVAVTVDDDGKLNLAEQRRGDTAATVIEAFGFDAATLEGGVRDELTRLIEQDRLSPEAAEDMLREYRETLNRYTYLT